MSAGRSSEDTPAQHGAAQEWSGRDERELCEVSGRWAIREIRITGRSGQDDAPGPLPATVEPVATVGTEDAIQACEEDPHTVLMWFRLIARTALCINSTWTGLCSTLLSAGEPWGQGGGNLSRRWHSASIQARSRRVSPFNLTAAEL